MKLDFWQIMSIVSLGLGIYSPFFLVGVAVFVAANLIERFGQQRDTSFEQKHHDEITKLRNEFKSLESKISMTLGKKLP